MVNNYECKVLRGDKFTRSQWKTLRVGEIVEIRRGEIVPADLVLLSTSELNNCCYIKTS